MARYALQRTTDAATEPVDLTEVKLHLRLASDGTEEDDLLTRLITAARVYFEDYTNRSLITTTWTLKLDNWYAVAEPCKPWLYLPRSPLASVTSVTYVATDGTSTTWDSSNYLVDTTSEPGRLALAYGKTWPVTRSQINAVTVVYTAGAASASAVPEGIKSAILCLISDLYYNRETVGEVGTKISLPVERILNHWVVGDSYFEFGGVE